MLVGADLAAWLNDPERQAEARSEAERFAERWSEHAAVKALKRELHAMQPRTADGVLAAAERFIARIDDFRGLVRDFGEAAAANPFFRPHFLLLVSDVATGILLYGASSVRSEEHTSELQSLM